MLYNSESGFSSTGGLLKIITLILIAFCAYLYLGQLPWWAIVPPAVIIFLFSLLGGEAWGISIIVLAALFAGYFVFLNK